MKKEEKIDQFTEFLRVPSVSESAGEEEACEYLEQILKEYGIESFRVSKDARRPNLVAVIRADFPTEVPLILISHIDVVPAEAKEWSVSPFAGARIDQRIWGRGTLDTKHLTMMELYAFLALSGKEKQLKRDVWLIATIDEETGSEYGMKYVKEEMPELFKDAYVINEGGGFPLCIQGKQYLMVTVGEKGTAVVHLEAEGTGGHASAPIEDQAVLKLTKALENIFSMKEKLESRTLQIYEKMKQVTEECSWDIMFGTDILDYCGQNSISMKPYKIGERSNVIPSKVEVDISFELLPDLDIEDMYQFLDDTIGNLPVTYKVTEFVPGFEMELESDVGKACIQQIEKICQEAGMPYQVLPMLALGHTDGRYFGIEGSKVLGFSPVLPEDSFDKVLKKIHGKDESIAEKSFLFGCEVIEQFVLRNCLKEIADEKESDI